MPCMHIISMPDLSQLHLILHLLFLVSALLLHGYVVELVRDTTSALDVYLFTAFQASTPFSPSLLLPILQLSPLYILAL